MFTCIPLMPKLQAVNQRVSNPAGRTVEPGGISDTSSVGDLGWWDTHLLNDDDGDVVVMDGTVYVAANGYKVSTA